MNRSNTSILLLLLLSAWWTLSVPALELASSPSAAGPVAAALLESRLPLCRETSGHTRGCAAVLRFLEETVDRDAKSTQKSLRTLPDEYPRLKNRLQALRVPEREWVTGAFNAWLAALDPHSKLVPAEESDRRASAERISVQGAGAKLRFHHGRVFVGYTMDGSAAEAAGLQAGDELISLNGQKLASLNDTAKRRCLSATQSPYQLIIQRNGAFHPLEILEKKYFLANVEAQVRTHLSGLREGLLRVRSFDKDNTCDEMRLAVHALRRAQVTSLRLDLRDNPGGLVREAQCAAGLFLGRKKTFALLKKKESQEAHDLIPAAIAGGSLAGEADTELFTTTAQVWALPLVVEVNQNTASAAEMLAAAIQDAQRAEVEGTRSFGKGSMQSVFHPWDDDRLYLTRTTHAIFRPSGRALQYEGIVPNRQLLSAEGENFPRERDLTL